MMQQQVSRMRSTVRRAAGPTASPQAWPMRRPRECLLRRRATSQHSSGAASQGLFTSKPSVPSSAPSGGPKPSSGSSNFSSLSGGSGTGGSGGSQEETQQAPGVDQAQQQQQHQQQEPLERTASPVEELLLTVLGSTDGASDGEGSSDGKANGGRAALGAALGFAGGIALLLGGGYVFRGPIRHFLTFFIDAVDEWGAWGYVAYALVYTGLEVLAVPAIPLTMTAGVIFHPLVGTALVSVSATTAATIAFLIARYAARDKILSFAKRNKRFAAVDRAISKDGLKFVTLLRLSPLLPLAASNYLYGLTSVDLGSYVLGSWIGMLPGTYAYVAAGHVGKAIMIESGESSGLAVAPWQVALGLGASLAAVTFIGQLAKRAVEEADAEAAAEEAGGSNNGSSGGGSGGDGKAP